MSARAVVPGIFLLVILVACGSAEEPATKTADNGDRINAIDVTFASHMVVHHAQAIQMVNLLRDHGASAELTTLGERLLANQVEQSNTLVTWLTDWGEPIPATPIDHVNADDHHGNGGGLTFDDSEMPGLLSSDQVAGLANLRGPDFDRAWSQLMLEQQDGAVTMAMDAQNAGEFGPAKDLAKEMAEDHRQTIEELRRYG